jgi:D-serine dehydratase
MVTEYDARYLAQQIAEHPDAEIYVIVDSKTGIDVLASAMKAAKCARPQRVLLDFGMRAGRTGVRTVNDVLALAKLVMASRPYLELAGIHGYEGIAAGDTREARLAAADAYLEELQKAARASRELCQTETFLVSAGGSQYFDRVIDWLGPDILAGCQLVLRTGGYVTHDSSFFDKSSPFGSQSWRQLPGEHLIPAIEIWSVILSIPEPGLAILGMGGRDMPTDIELPVPLLHSRKGAVATKINPLSRIVRSNDQHAYMNFPPNENLVVGDFVGSGISHPCTAFDKWRSIFVVDDEYRVIDIFRTYF